jgi:tetratricopeptide (TPR) repeat protein
MDPQDPYVASIIPDIYLRTNRTDKAKAQYEKMLQENPNKALYTSFGTFLLKSNDYQGAVTAYERALSLDPAYEPALFNTAATYKNWAAAEQKAKKADYKTKLEKSTEYFERLVTLNSAEMNALQNLIENYDLLGKKDKLTALMTRLESLKSSPVAEQAEFWESLGTLYAKNNRTKESAEAFQRADRIKTGR